MSATSAQLASATERPLLDAIVERLRAIRLSLDEEDALRGSHWAMGQDVRMRDDIRLRPTPWHRWMLADGFLANDTVFAQLRREHRGPQAIDEILKPLDKLVGRRCYLCPADPRLVIENGTVRLSARELSEEPLIEESVVDLERYSTHLPVHSLQAAAASLPAGQWGRRAQEEVIETLGWIRVTLSGRRLNSRMFIAQLEGHSMDDGRSGLVDGGYAVFELWPSGSKQNLNVLLRGAFKDPETGGYALKRYVADERDEEGRHRRVMLVSLNPNKERFPNIELNPEDDDDVTVVAKVIQALSPNDFARRPKPLRRRGRRDISSPEAEEKISEQLAKDVDRFFAAAPQPSAVDEKRPDMLAWEASLICLDAAAGGLHIEVGPLQGLWSFVKRLTVEGCEWTSSLLASNVRLRAARVPVPPSTGPWRWLASGFEDDPDIDLSRLAVGGLAGDRPLLFRVDAEGVGRLVRFARLSPGHAYRVLIPVQMLSGTAKEHDLMPAGAGWLLWEVEVPQAPSPQLLEFARQLGFDIGEAEPRLEWVLTPPTVWRANAKGETYPCFVAEITPTVQLCASHVEAIGDASVFVHGPNGTVTTKLPPGDEHLLRLGELTPGRYVVMVLHQRIAVPTPKLLFEIIDERPAPSHPIARVTIGQECLVAQPGELVISAPRDISAPELTASFDGLRIEAPPGWTVRAIWRELADEVLLQLTVSEDGEADGPAFVAALRERFTRRPIGDVIFDFSELGRIVLQHERRPDPASLRERFSDLVASKAAAVDRLAGAFVDLLPIWFEPVVAGLGFDVQLMPEGTVPEPPEHAMVLRLLHVERARPRIQRKIVRVLVLLEKLNSSLSPALLSWIDESCGVEDVREALLSDGLRWAAHRRGSRLDLAVWDLSAAVNDAESFLSFLRTAAEGI